MRHKGTVFIECDRCGRQADTGEVWTIRSLQAAELMGWDTGDGRSGPHTCPACREVSEGYHAS